MLSAIIPGTVFGQQSSGIKWTFDGSLRYRFEKWDNMNALYYGNSPAMGAADDNILLQRIIAGPTVHFNDIITLSVHLQDSRAYGWSLSQWKEPDAFKKHPQESADPYYIMNPQEEFLEIYDLNLRIDSILNIFSLIAGRQKIAYTDCRVFGPGSWGNTGRWTWDAIQIIIEEKKWSGGIWFGGTKIHDPVKTYLPFTNTEFTGGGLHGKIHLTDFLDTDLYMAHKRQGSADYIRNKSISRNWVGFRLYNPTDRSLKYEISSTLEYGKVNDSRIRAFGLFFKLGYQSNQILWHPCLTLRYTYASGNSAQTDYNENFDPVFGARDRYYGRMNLVKWSNLDDREIMIELFPLNGMRIEMNYNRFAIPQQEGVLINGNLELLPGKKHLGNEIDFYAIYDI
ncbi:MAG: alginate export family protein, partial [Bacteroidales bacterium]